MRAEQWMMVGVGAIGVYAIYRLSQASGGTRAVPAPDTTPLMVSPPSPLDTRIDTSLPAAPGSPDPPPSTLATLVGSPVNLRGGSYYKGRLETGVPGSLPANASNADIAAYLLQTLGLTSIEVFRTAAEAAPIIGQPSALVRPGQGTRWFRGRLPAVETGPRNRPANLVLLWQASPPAPAARISGLAWTG